MQSLCWKWTAARVCCIHASPLWKGAHSGRKSHFVSGFSAAASGSVFVQSAVADQRLYTLCLKPCRQSKACSQGELEDERKAVPLGCDLDRLTAYQLRGLTFQPQTTSSFLKLEGSAYNLFLKSSQFQLLLLNLKKF